MDETVVITGAGSGLGAAIAREFGSTGATVVLGDRDHSALRSVADDVESADGTAHRLRTDARDEFDLERLMETASREAGPIDGLIPAAEVAHGTDSGTPLVESAYSAFDDTIRTSLRGPFAAIREAVPHLAPDARILIPVPPTPSDPPSGSGPYGVAKAGVGGLVSLVSAELEQTVGAVDHGIEVAPLSDSSAVREAAPLFVSAMDVSVASLDGNVLSRSDLQSATSD